MKRLIGLLVSVICLFCILSTIAFAEDGWTCPECGRINSADANFCGNCRASKPSVSFSVPNYTNAWVCSGCRHICPNTDNFCTKCGTDHYASDLDAVMFELPDKYDVIMPSCTIRRIPYTVGVDGNDFYTAYVSGPYYFWIEDQPASFFGKITIYDDYGKTIAYTDGYSDSPSRLYSLSAGTNYRVVLSDYHGNSFNVTLCIGEPRETQTLYGTDAIQVIQDSIDYRWQENNYLFIPQTAGQYRVDISEMKNGQTVEMKVQDELGYVIAQTYGTASMGDGLTFDAETKNYYIIITGRSDLGEYKFTLHADNPIKEASGCNAIGDNIYYEQQVNTYQFIAPQTGDYTFTLDGVSAECDFRITIVDPLGYTQYGWAECTASLNAGDVYKIQIEQYRGIGSYSLFIQYP